MKVKYNLEELVERLLRGDKFATARLISMAENDASVARRIVSLIYPSTGNAHVVGVTGPPGSGKSTLVHKMVKEWRKLGKTVGVLAVDPSSPFTGGALLGDRIRMQDLTGDEGVFIRSMATRGNLGGISRATRDAVKILDASGKEVVVVETVGAGQSEVDIMRVAHTILVVLCPGLGDEIQTLKAGIIEIGDIFVVNKSDREDADETALQLEDMLNMSPTIRSGMSGWIPPVVKTSAIMNTGVKELVDKIEEHRRFLRRTKFNEYIERWARQEVLEALRGRLEEIILKSVTKDDSFNKLIRKVGERRIDPYTAADMILSDFLNKVKG